jgi:hypothetical protein
MYFCLKIKMMIILEILKYTLPSVVVFFTAYYLLKEQNARDIAVLNLEEKKETRKKNQEVLLPIRLQAHERLIMFLERIHPHQLIVRLSSPSLTAFKLQTILIKSIRDEFEHNLSQQLYVSNSSWTKLIRAKEECIKQVNVAAAKLNSDAAASDLGGLIIQNYSALKPDPIHEAIQQMKKEVQNGL